ncbi:MAG: hypothetical protein NXI03_11540 [Alphaproteobacteria bacterium]|nr:hypothetical protein [Alphaproteobacteria bacterium]
MMLHRLKSRLSAAALVCAIGLVGGLAACNQDDIASTVRAASLETAKSVAGVVLSDALKGDNKASNTVIGALEEYCERVSADTRGAFRSAFSVDGKAAVTVDCDAVRALSAKRRATSRETEPPGDRRQALALVRAGGRRAPGRG